MIMKISVRLITILLLSFAWVGCVFEESVGPEGPPGNANVFSLNFDFVLADAVFNGTVASVQFDIPDITPLVVDEGAVIMYFRDQGTWTAMPYTYGVESEDVPAVDYTVSLGFGFDVGFLEVFYETSIDALDVPDLVDREMKAVIIDSFAFGKQDVDLSDWNAVQEFYGLKD